MKFGDRSIGLITVIGGFALLYASSEFGTPPGQPIGAGFFPTLIAIVLIAAGIGLIIKEQSRVWRGETVAPLAALVDVARSPSALLSIAVLFGSIIFFIYAVTPLGFIPTAFVITLAITLRLSMSWRYALLTAVVLPIVFNLLFVKGLRVPLPPGILQGII